jgi:hypothetical protein
MPPLGEMNQTNLPVRIDALRCGKVAFPEGLAALKALKCPHPAASAFEYLYPTEKR